MPSITCSKLSLFVVRPIEERTTVSPDPADSRSPARRGWPDGFGLSTAERQALLRIAHATFLPPASIHALALEEGTATGVERRARSGALGKAAAAIIAEVDSARACSVLREVGARLVTPADREYATSLLDLHDPPACLFVRGRPLSVPWPAAAIVGSRSASAYGVEMATAIARGLAARGITVVSGAAYGIDAAAHKGALAVGGPTVAVLGSGIDIAYPASHRGLIDEAATHGSVVSEYPPGAEARPKHFPARNRIVVALASAVIVVEGATGSGSLISAEFAQQLGREIMAVPGAATSTLAEVPNALIRDGATLLRGPTDALEALLGFGAFAGAASASRLEGVERGVLDALGGGPTTAEAVAASSGVALGRALAALSALELAGLVRERGGRYERTALSVGS